MNVEEQLEAIVRHIGRTIGRKDLKVADVFSHVIVAELSEERIAELSSVQYKGDKAKELFQAVLAGEAQVSKKVEGIQPPVTEDTISSLKTKGLEVSIVGEEHITGVNAGAKKPLYDNDYLYEVLKSIAPRAFEGASSPVKIRDGFKDLLGTTIGFKVVRVFSARLFEVYLEVGQAVGATYYAAHKTSTSSSPINNLKSYERSFREVFKVSREKRISSKADLNSVGRKDPNYPRVPFPHLAVFAFPQGAVLDQVVNLRNQLQGALSQELEDKIRLLKREDLHMTVMGTKWDEGMI